MSAYKDAQSQNDISRNARQYSDLDLFFGKRVVGSDVNKVTDIQAVKRSVRNILLTNHYERPFKPNFGANLRAMLFELDGIGAKKRIKKNIITTLSILEPRIGNIKVDISESESNNIDVRVSYIIRNGLKQSSVDFKVSRVR